MKKIFSALMLFGFVSNVYATDIQIMWNAPAEYTDGTAITEIDRFTLYYTINNAVQEPIQIAANATNYTLANVEKGTYVFQVSATSLGQEGSPSDPVTVINSAKIPSKMVIEVRVIEVSESGITGAQ